MKGHLQQDVVSHGCLSCVVSHCRAAEPGDGVGVFGGFFFCLDQGWRWLVATAVDFLVCRGLSPA